ncbi:calcium channel protein [Mortierella sp. AM989]|nr:calcium channel protein [Mortierella sp. AM989]
MVQNRSSILGAKGATGAEHSGGWMGGLSEVMASVSSRVVNTRAQEQYTARPSISSQGDPLENEPSDNHRSHHRNSIHKDASASSDALAWTSGSVHGPGSDHGSARIRRSTSGRSSSTNAGGTNLGARTSQQGQQGQIQGTDISRTGTGSHLGKINSQIPEKAHKGDEESVFAPGGFVHRGEDKMQLEGRSLKIFSPENPLRLWLASILMSKLEIIAKSIVYGLFFDRNGFQWEKWMPKSMQHLVSSRISSKATQSVKMSHSLSRVNSARSRISTNEKLHAQPMTPTVNEALETPVVGTDTKPAHAPFFRSYYNRLDGTVVTCYWIDFIFMMMGIREVYVFKAISSLRPLRLLSLTEGTSTIIDSLSMSAPLLLMILGFIFFFLLILSLIGLLLFQGALSRRCAVQQAGDPNVWVPASPEMICGGYYSNGTILGVVNYIGQGDGDDSSPRYSARICQEGQIFFTVSSMEGWADVEYWVMDGDSKYAAFYFCAAIFLMSFLLIPLFIAGITYSFGAVRAEKRHSAFSNKSRKTRILLDTDEGWQFEDQVHQVRSPIRQWLIRIVNDPWFSGGGAFLYSVIGSTTGMLNLLLITFMFLLVCSPAPMFLFGGDMFSDQDQPINFDDLGQSFISLFIILTGENWVNIMYEGLDAHPQKYKQAYGGIFFVIFYCASHYVLLNLFVAIVLENFELEDDEKYRKQLEIYFSTHQRSKAETSKGFFQYLNPYAYLPARPQTLSVHGLPLDQMVSIRKNVFRQFLEGDSAPNASETTESENRVMVWLERIFDYWFPTQAQIEAMESAKLLPKNEKPDLNQLNGGVSRFGKTQDEIDASLERLDADLEKITWDKDRSLDDPRIATETLSTEGHRRAATKAKNVPDRHRAEMQEFLEAHPMYDRSLFLLPSHNRFRQWCHRLVGSRSYRDVWTMNRFNWFIFLCIGASILVIILDDPIDRKRSLLTGDTKRQDILGDADYVITIIFVVEQCLRILADGFFFTPTAYLRDLWNFLDLFVVVTSCVKTFAQIDHFYSASRAIRALSCLRVLRIIRYFKGVSAMVKAIAKALPRMVVALVLTVLLFWPFAIYGVNIYAGYFYLCNDNTVSNKFDCVGEFMNEPDGDDSGDILIPREWNNPYEYSFDTFQAAILTLFEMASQEGWVMIMQSGRAVPNHLGEQPYIQPEEPNRFNSFYFLVFMLIGSIVFVQIFIGVILEAFNTWNGMALLTVEQRRWLDLRRQLRTIKPTATPDRPDNPIRAFCYDLVIEKKGLLWKIMTSILILNVGLIASQHYAQPDILTDVQDISYFIFLGLYSVEIVIKVLGYGPHKWRLSRWNLYDLAITALALITLIPRFIGHELWTLRLEKFLLITISFRLAQRIDSLQVLFRALTVALGSILNITAVFMIVFTVYAVMFREIFGMTRLGPSTTNLANFDSFGNTMLMLIRMTTGENWDFVMHDMMVEAPNCTPSSTSYLDGDCGSQSWAYFLFLSFYIICTYILLNMFIAVIISNFSFAYQQDSITTLITREDLRNYKMTWAKFDPRGTGYIDAKNLSLFLTSLEGRLCTRVYAKPEYSIPNLVKTYSLSSGSSVSRSGSFKEGASAPSSPSLNNGSTSHRSVLGLGSNRKLNQLSVSPSLSATTSHHETNPSSKAVPITISGPETDVSEEKQNRLNVKLDLQGLQQTLSRIDTMDVYHRRKNYNLVYKEALATCSSRGVSFYSILDILSFTLVDTEQALGMDEFLKRQERVKEVRAAVARETIYNLLLAIAARRNFLKRRAKQNARLRPEVPRIVIDNSIGNDYDFRPESSPMLNSSPSGRSSFLPSPTLDFSKGQSNYHSDDDISPIGAYSTNTRPSIGSYDSNSWDLSERDSFNRLSGISEISDLGSEGSPTMGFALEGSPWHSMLQDQIREQDDTSATYSHYDSRRLSS